MLTSLNLEVAAAGQTTKSCLKEQWPEEVRQLVALVSISYVITYDYVPTATPQLILSNNTMIYYPNNIGRKTLSVP